MVVGSRLLSRHRTSAEEINETNKDDIEYASCAFPAE